MEQKLDQDMAAKNSVQLQPVLDRLKWKLLLVDQIRDSGEAHRPSDRIVGNGLCFVADRGESFGKQVHIDELKLLKIPRDAQRGC